MPRPSPPPAVLTSRDNKWLKEFRQALRGGEPTHTGAVGVEGLRLVEEALTSNCRIEAVLFSEKGERLQAKLAALLARRDPAVPILRTTDRLFEGLADTEHPQGVAALVSPRKFDISEVFSTSEKANVPLILVLAGVQDPGNVGTILRTAAAFGATAAVATATSQNGTASPFAPKALRASAGAALHLPTVTGLSLPILLTQLKLNNIATVASCVEEEFAGAVPPWQINWREPVALLIGNEGAGLPEDVAKAADARVHIPIAARIESLNAAAAAAVVLYEAFRQRSGGTLQGEAEQVQS
jgi:RNA methyltransferase, TrmH family